MSSAESLAQSIADTLRRHGPVETAGLFDRLVGAHRLRAGDGFLLAEGLAWAFAEGMVRASHGGLLHADAEPLAASA